MTPNEEKSAAMKTCPSCSRELADNALTCPHCGHKFVNIGAIVRAAIIIGFVIVILTMMGVIK